jgi:hypothetical protein
MYNFHYLVGIGDEASCIKEEEVVVCGNILIQVGYQ